MIGNEEKIKVLLEFVENQACDDGIWFCAKYATEDYLQVEIRKLHYLIEELFLHDSYERAKNE